MIILACWVVFSVVIGWVASERGRDGLGWFLIALIISPLLGFLLLVAVPVKTAVAEKAPGQFPERQAWRPIGMGERKEEGGKIWFWTRIAIWLALGVPMFYGSIFTSSNHISWTTPWGLAFHIGEPVFIAGLLTILLFPRWIGRRAALGFIAARGSSLRSTGRS